MIPSPHPELVGRSIVMRRFDSSQIHDRYIGWLNDPVVNAHSRRLGLPAVGEHEARGYLEGLVGDEIVLAIHHPDHGHVGNLKYGPVDWPNQRSDISILIGERAVWGKGLGAEAMYLATAFLFRDLGLNRVDAGSNNPAFLAMVSKLGWRVEGVLQQWIRIGDRFADHTLVALLKQQFETRPEFERPKAMEAR
jgi:RimJ/RimL family protein N-acetyltransferase